MKIDRLVSIIMMLLDKKRIGAQDLADHFEVSSRTIYRDIESINMAGIPVFSVPGLGGGFEIMPEYKIEKNVLSTSDLSTILTGLSGLSNVMHGDELVHVLAKIKNFIPADRVKDVALKVNQICIDMSPWIGNKDIFQSIESIKIALQEQKLLSFEYSNRHGIRTLRTAEPYQLILKNSHWYVYGYCCKRNDFRLFKLARIADLKIEDAKFSAREYQSPLLDFTDVAEGMQRKIKIRIHSSVMDRALDYCSIDNFLPDGDDHYIVSFPFIENDYYYNIILGFGSQCECLSPLSVRTEVMRRIQEMAAMYENLI